GLHWAARPRCGPPSRGPLSISLSRLFQSPAVKRYWLVLLLNGVCTPTTQLALLNSIAIRQRARASLRAVDVVSTKRASIGLSYARLVVGCIHRTGTTTWAAP